MIIEPRISVITLGVRDVHETYDFYSKILGFPSTKGVERDIVFFNLSHMLLAICPRDKLAEDACVPDDGSGFSGITLVHNVKSQQKVDEIIQNLRKAGVRVTKEPQSLFGAAMMPIFKTQMVIHGKLPGFLRPGFKNTL